MSLFDLLFLVVFFATIFALVLAVWAALRGRRARAGALLRRIGIFVALYLGVVILVSLLSPRRVVQVGEDQCWDDWCLTITNVQRTPIENGSRYVVTIRLFSRARRAAQRGRGTQVYLMDDRGRRYDPIPEPDAIPFDILLQPQEAVRTTRVFELPSDAADPVLVASHGEGFPGWFIIGDSASLFHQRPVVRLE